MADGSELDQLATQQVDEAELVRLVQDEAMSLPDMNIAVSGLAGRFPKANSLNEFEANLRQGVDMVNEQDNSRFTCGLWGLPPRAGRLKDLSRFDFEFFGFAPEEANYIDYQLRILYEVVYESILDAGLNPATLRGSRTGVFFGLHCNEFENAMADEPAFKSNGYYAQFAVKVAQYFDFRGINVTFDAACASGFVGLHNAVEAINEGLVEQAIVCSSNIPIHPTGSFIFLQMQMLSPSGYSRFLDSRADGYVKSEACVSLLLQRKNLARRNYCSFLATMTSVDGYKREGITFPSDRSQEQLIRATKELAGVSTNHVEYLEAHGTGTPAGDPQEARAISNVYFPSANKRSKLVSEAETELAVEDGGDGELPETEAAIEKVEPADKAEGEQVVGNQTVVGAVKSGKPKEPSAEDDIFDEIHPPPFEAAALVEHEAEAETKTEALKRRIGPLLVGSVKTNMGHSEAASGLCALAKVVLMLENEIIYKNLHYDQPNTNIEALMDGRLKLVVENLPLRAKIIPLSCYGFGGSNVHAIVRASERPAIGEVASMEVARDERSSSPSSNSSRHLDSNGNSLRLVLMFGRSKAGLGRFFDQLLDGEDPATRNCLTEDFFALLDSLCADKIDRLMDHRGFLVVDREQRKELARSIRRCELRPADMDPGLEADLGRRKHFQEARERLCNLILPGVGSQWPAMARGLTKFQPFWSTIERLANFLMPFEDDVNLLPLLISLDEDDSSLLELSMCNCFVAIVAYQVALLNILRQLKFRNEQVAAIVGHSLGEISCAYASGLFDEREAIMVAYRLGKTLDENRHLIGGRMVAIASSLDEAERLIGADCKYSTVRVCCVNGPQSVTISGSSEQMEELVESLNKQNIYVHPVSNLFALHNEQIMTDDIKRRLKEALERVLLPLTDYSRSGSKWISSFARVSDPVASQADADYFAEMLCKRVDFYKAIDGLEDDSIALEIGPCGLFESQLSQMKPRSSSWSSQAQRRFHYVKMMKRSLVSQQQAVQLVSSIGELYQVGGRVDLLQFYHGDQTRQELFPVRRRTPSVSSLINWKHDQQLFVPRYPVHFSKSSAKCEMPVELIQDRDKYLSGHCIEGRVLFPATGYLFLIWRVFSFTKRHIYDACFHEVESELVPIEFRHVRLLRAVMLGQSVSQIYLHFEEASGKFEVKEGGQVVCDGYAYLPSESPKSLLFEAVKERIRSENLEYVLTKDDIYKQFRISGYDYGETFRNIETCSFDGRRCKVQFNGHFVALTDSILQSIFLSVIQYAPSGGLFLPTGFDYVRFQPEPILRKMREANMGLDSSEGSLNTMAKREMMAKMMQREASQQAASEESTTSGAVGGEEKTEELKPECFFETFCDPITGIIVTDGIEMRGIKPSPAPRRVDNNEVLLESYQFVRDLEEPVDDERLTRFQQVNERYSMVCDSMALQVLAKLCAGGSLKPLDALAEQQILLGAEEIESYKRKHLECIYSQYNATNIIAEQNGEQQVRDKEVASGGNEAIEEGTGKKSAGGNLYDIKKNGSFVLMSLFDQLLSLGGELSQKQIKKRIQANRLHLMRDLLQDSFVHERYVRPLVETVIENVCQKKMKLRLLEINLDDGIMRTALQPLIQQIEPSLSVDYSIAHPELSRLSAAQKASGPSGQIKTHTLKDLPSLFADNQIKELDLIIYKDISCYSLPRQVVEQNGLRPVVSSLYEAVRLGGYVLMVMRRKLTLAERVLLALSEPELVGLSKRELEILERRIEDNGDSALAGTISKIERINAILGSRCELMINEAKRNQMLLVASKSDQNGCLMSLFRRTVDDEDKVKANGVASGQREHGESGNEEEAPKSKRLVLRVRHDQLGWLDELKANFKQPEAPPASDQSEQQEADSVDLSKESTEQVAVAEVDEPKLVWLCAVVTKENPINGLIGLMQSLRRELGAKSLRCYYDAYSFKDCNEPISVEQIERCARFRAALERDHLWNCYDSNGCLGSYRHLTINEYLSHEKSLCSKQDSDECNRCLSGAYVNTATRGDLSSFAWYEAPFRFLSQTERSQLVRVAYSALNFRDIMLATGRLPLDALPIRLARSDCLLGLEFSGVDMDSKRVMGMVYGRGIATHVRCPKETSFKIEIPDSMSLREAATIPVVYATALMALVYRGRMQRGESILVHAGSGGVGQAAIRLAHHWGLEVFTTVGSAEKRKFMLEEFGHCLDEAHIFNSRDCSFELAILQATRGRGVDLVLNSLADDKLQASLRCLADGGRFLEIGKYDMSINARLELLKLNTNKTFHGILLDKLFDTDEMSPAFKEQMESVANSLDRGLAEGFVRPIKSRVFKRNQIEAAFRYMATGKHIGKVLIEIEDSAQAPSFDPRQGVSLKCIPRFQMAPEKSYIVTGGLGGFGLELIKWLVNQGGKRIVITSRTGLKTGYQRATLCRLESNNGAHFLVVDEATADATCREGCERLCQMAADFAPSKELGGVFHLAMVLKDSLLENMNQEDFRLVCRPKVDTCLHLDAVTRGLTRPLDVFVAFSSISCGKGNAGQSNYAYANSCLERICELRRADGLHGLAIQWGAIGDVGVAFENLGGNDVIIGGTLPQRMPSCMATLDKLLCSPFATCLSVLPVSRSGDGAAERGDLVGAIMHVLGIKDPSKVSEEATLGDLGLDSLMAVEIRQYIEREYDITLNIQEIRSLTIAKIREISENERPAAKAAAERKDQSKREVSSYSSLNQEGQGQKQGSESIKNKVAAIKEEVSKHENTIGAFLDKNMVSTFKPKLELPKDDFCRLNYKFQRQFERAAAAKALNLVRASQRADQARPIFFIPPIHGDFDCLELVCSSIARPCIGLNWTRKLGRARTAEEAVGAYLNILQQADWQRDFCLPDLPMDESTRELTVDLVGYSYGATIAFEMMLALHRAHEGRRNGRGPIEAGGDCNGSNGSDRLPTKPLRPGKLVLLDGSPKQIELGSLYLENLTRKRPLKLSEKIDELLMIYAIAHTRHERVDYLKLHRKLKSAKIEQKIPLTSSWLFDVLHPAAREPPSKVQNGKAKGNGNGNGKPAAARPANEDERLEIALAMEAFCRRYELISNYKTSANLPTDCTLIRAEKVYLSKGDKEEKYNEDLDLSTVIDGQVDLHVMKGDHETFLNINHRLISEIIVRSCRLSSAK